MRIENVVKALKERQAQMEKRVLAAKEHFDPVKFAKEQGLYQGLSEAIIIISDQMRESNED